MTPDLFAPRGEIGLVREALLRFAPAGWRLPFDRASQPSRWNLFIAQLCCFLFGAELDGDLDAVFRALARSFNQARNTWAGAPRPGKPKNDLDKIARAARALAAALEKSDDLTRHILLRDAMGPRSGRRVSPSERNNSPSYGRTHSPRLRPQVRTMIARSPSHRRSPPIAFGRDEKTFLDPTIARDPRLHV